MRDEGDQIKTREVKIILSTDLQLRLPKAPEESTVLPEGGALRPSDWSSWMLYPDDIRSTLKDSSKNYLDCF